MSNGGSTDATEGLGELLLPGAVWTEVQAHRPSLNLDAIGVSTVVRQRSPLSPSLSVLVRSLNLGKGETAALALLQLKAGNLLLTDDSAARLAAEALSFKVHGTIGIIIRGIRRGKRSPAAVKAILKSIPTCSTLHIERGLLNRVIGQIDSVIH